MAAARRAATHSLDEEEVKEVWRSVEAASSKAAREAARADAQARAAKKKDPAQAQLLELERLKAENEALKRMVSDVVANKAQAQEKLASLRQQHGHLFEKGENGQGLLAESNGSTEQQVENLLQEVTQDPPEQHAQTLQHKQNGSGPSSKPSQPDSSPLRQLQPITELALSAIQSRRNLFTLPEAGIPTGGASPVPPGEPSRLYYDRAGVGVGGGALPQGAQPVLKAGINNWEVIRLLDMQKAEALEATEGEWWSVDINLTEDVHAVDFVILANRNPGAAVDNNRQQNYTLQLSGALTQEQILNRRAEAVAAFEQRNMQALEAEEDRLWQEQMQAAGEAAEAARGNYVAAQEEVLREHAREAAEARRGAELGDLPTEPGRPGVFAWLHNGPSSGQRAVLAYNKAASPLRQAADVVLRVGFDAWWQLEHTEIPMRPLGRSHADSAQLPEDGEWWMAHVDIPPAAVVVDFVLCDSDRRLWDNNHMVDYHSVVRDGLDVEQLTEHLFQESLQEARARIQEGADRAAARVLVSTEVRAAAKRRRRARQHQIVFTDPPIPRAGQPLEVLYNPDVTALRGRPETWIRAGWNRWSHSQSQSPQLMESAVPGGVGFHRASLQVPEDAWDLDMVFADSANEAAFCDNNTGLDYHVPVVGSRQTRPQLNVVHVAVEMAPVAKVGGMGDVVTALARAVQDEGHRVSVIIPKYDCLDYDEVRDLHLIKDYFWSGTQIKVWQGQVEGLTTIFLEPSNGTFWVGCIYGRNDDAARFGFFCGAALEYLNFQSDSRADIVHAHDWQSAPMAFGNLQRGTKAAFTIHNLNFGADLIGRAMGGAAVCTTVSPTYAAEISGHPSIAPNMGKFYGIRNGIDNDIWDPAMDRFLPRTYGADDAEAGKAAAKAELRQKMNLSNADVPLVAVVTRLTHQKGIHLIKHAAWRTLERGGQFVLLGSAPDPRVQGEFNALANDLGRQYPDRARLWFAYNEPLSHLIYAGSDIFLVPSMFEPCGLTQMIAMRYGSVPCVRRTGGLADTVFDVDDDEDKAQSLGMTTNGYIFEGTDAGALDYALNRALSSWYTKRDAWGELTRRVMQQDWSWADPALDYLDLYYKALKP